MAVPVMPYDAKIKFKKLVDELVVLDAPRDFLGWVGSYYESFGEVSDGEVVELMKHTDKTD